MRVYTFFCFFIVIMFSLDLEAQYPDSLITSRTRKDSLRGMLRPERTCYDVSHYTLDITIDPSAQSVSGTVEMSFSLKDSCPKMQIDLFDNMVMDSILFLNEHMSFQRDGNVVWINTSALPTQGQASIKMHYHGHPTVAQRAPWDGGFVWSEDSNGLPWIGVACEGDGASLWWPLKDHLSDEPDSMDIYLTAPRELISVSNGNPIARECNENWCRAHWKVGYAINSYNVTLNIADFVHFHDIYHSDSMGDLSLNYYVLRENEEIARRHFEQVPGVLEAFEHWFGPYPYWSDGYALVETPYLGMEHQSAIAYGNKYKRGYLGRLSPDTLNFDYIIVHETGHEYWGNSISCDDHSEMWIHEAFTTYMEALYVEYHYDLDIATQYLLSQRPYIANLAPIVGPRDINFLNFVSSDHYYKGSWILHTFRQLATEDVHQWAMFLRHLYERFSYSVTDTESILAFIDEYFDEDYSWFWDQYLFRAEIPVWNYRIQETDKRLPPNESQTVYEVEYFWSDVHEGFEMPFYLDDNPTTTETQSFLTTLSPPAFRQKIEKEAQNVLVKVKTLNSSN